VKNLTAKEQTLVSGGNPLAGFLIGYLGEKLLEVTLESAKNKKDLFQDTNMSLPYNRL
jgi:hypothetical protein